MNRGKMMVALLVAGCVFSGCGANNVVFTDEYEAVAYNLYPCPEGAYVGDTMPFVTNEGDMELYYLYDTDHNGQAYHPIHKYSTRDFISYEDCGEVLKFGLLSDPDPAIGTGSVLMDQEGGYHIFYTGHNDTGNKGMGKECVMHATSSDCANWTKIPEDTFYSPDNYSKDDFRDPEVFWVPKENCYWMLLAARDNLRGGVVAKYTSVDLSNWEFCGPLYAPNDQYMLECPSIIRIGDQFYLTYSWDCVTYYAVADSINGPYVAPEDNVLDGTGFAFYAAKTKHFSGNDYLCGWLGRVGTTVDTGAYQWAGNVLNHQLVQLEDDRLGVKEPDSFSEYFTQETQIKNPVNLKTKEDAYSMEDLGVRPATMMLECDVTIDEGAVAGFSFGDENSEKTPTGLCVDRRWNMLHYEGYALDELKTNIPEVYTKFDFSKKDKHHIKLICENEIVIAYIDDEKVLSSRILNSINGAHIGFFTAFGNASFENIIIKTP